MRICSILIFHLSKQWKAKFFILCDVILLVRLQEKFEIDQSWEWIRVNPFTPESDQCHNSPAASQEIWHHTVWRTWLFIAYSDEKWLYYKFSLHHSYNRFLKGWENTLFELRSENKDLWFDITKEIYQIIPQVATLTTWKSVPLGPQIEGKKGGLMWCRREFFLKCL